MEDYLILSPCGCISPTFMAPAAIKIIDSELITIGFFAIGIQFNNIKFSINHYFATKPNFISWLNTTFTTYYELIGTFQIIGHQIFYSNNENYLNAEIMAINSTRLLCYKFGLGGGSPIYGYDEELSNGDMIPGDLLTSKILSIRWGDTDTGRLIDIELRSANLAQDSTDNSITFTQPYEDGNMWIMLTDEPVGGFPYTLPLILSA